MERPILITGAAGSGKSHLAQYIKGHGINAVDIDTIPSLSAWTDLDGHKVNYHPGADDAWRNKHKYVWDKQVLNEFIEFHRSSVLLGLSDDDALSFKDVFSAVVYLKVPADVIAARLKDRGSPYGKTDEQQQSVLRDLAAFDNKAERNGYIIVDGSQPPEKIWQDITELLNHF